MNKAPTGTLYKKNGYYYARIYYYINGERKTKDKATKIATDGNSNRKTKQLERAANQFLTDFLQTFSNTGKICLSSVKDPMLVETAQAWFDHICNSKAPSTVSSYAYILKDITLYFTELCPVRTRELTPCQVEEYLAWERMRRQSEYAGKYKVHSRSKEGSGIENTVDHRYKVLSSILQYAKRDGIITRNVASRRDCQLSVPKPQRQEFPVLTVPEAEQLIISLANEPLWFQLAVLLGLLCGLRRSEIIGLRASDIDMSANTLTITRTATQQTINHKNTIVVKPFTKNRKPKVFTLTDQFKNLLCTLIDKHQQYAIQFGSSYDTNWSDYLMRYPDGRLISPNTLTRIFGNFIDRNNFKDIRFHDLRHSCASILYASGVDLMTIQEILGHQQLTTTLSYTHMLSDRKTAALTQMHTHFLEVPQASLEESEN